MAISPIDLQTLFTQVDKVGKQEAAQRTGTAIQQSIQQAQIQQKTDERIRSVNEAQDAGEGAEGVRNRNGGGPGHESGGRRKEEAGKETPPPEEVIRDPALGKNIDISF
ncbi:MAG: hypothetical protein LBD31_01080 [Treponema sp.]|jgi:type II secretory pathway pseudopilin PulG|nr:hypothetical protein [Treponema sp.]